MPLNDLSPIFTDNKKSIAIHSKGLSQQEIHGIKLINDSAKFIKVKLH